MGLRTDGASWEVRESFETSRVRVSRLSNRRATIRSPARWLPYVSELRPMDIRSSRIMPMSTRGIAGRSLLRRRWSSCAMRLLQDKLNAFMFLLLTGSLVAMHTRCW